MSEGIPNNTQVRTSNYNLFGDNMGEDKVLYNGVWIHPFWPAKIEKAQQITKVTIGGKTYSRIKYGDEDDDWGADSRPCHDCAVIKGQYHVPSCDVERCPSCGGQAIGCDCDEVIL